MLDDRFQTVFDFPLQQAFAEHWENFIDIIHYNKNISNVRVITELSSHADVVYVSVFNFYNLRFAFFFKKNPLKH